MPSYMFEATYTAEGIAGVLKEGGSGRLDAVTTMAKGLGGKVDAFYFAFGEPDVYVIAELPDARAAAALAMTVGAAGSVSIKTTVLLSTADVDAASKIAVDYRPPGA